MVVVLPTPLTPMTSTSDGLVERSRALSSPSRPVRISLRISSTAEGSVAPACLTPVPELLHHPLGDRHADIGEDQRLLELVEEVLVHPGETGGDVLQAAHQRIPGLLQPGGYLIKKSP